MNIINEFFVSFILIKLYFKFKVCRKIKFPLLWKFYFSKWKFYFSADKKDEILENLGDADIIIMSCIGGILGFEYGFLVLFIASILTLPFFIFFRIKAIKEQELAMIPFLNIAFVAVLFYKNLGLF